MYFQSTRPSIECYFFLLVLFIWSDCQKTREGDSRCFYTLQLHLFYESRFIFGSLREKYTLYLPLMVNASLQRQQTSNINLKLVFGFFIVERLFSSITYRISLLNEICYSYAALCCHVTSTRLELGPILLGFFPSAKGSVDGFQELSRPSWRSYSEKLIVEMSILTFYSRLCSYSQLQVPYEDYFSLYFSNMKN